MTTLQSSPTERTANPSLTVEVTVTVKARQRLDLVAYFAGLLPAAQVRYRNLDLSELGMSAEWERPIAFLWPDPEDVVPLALVPGAMTPVHGDIDEADIRVQQRAGAPIYGRVAEWTEGDFENLAAQVPWLRRVFEANTGLISDEHLARVPGPDDVPLF